MKRFIVASLFAAQSASSYAGICEKEKAATSRFDENYVEERLQDDGIVAYVHSAVPSQKLFVISVKNPDLKLMFDTLEFPISGFDQSLVGKVKNLKRHDKICLTGQLDRAHGKPIAHVFVTDFKVLTPSIVDASKYAYEEEVMEELKTKNEIIAKVHISLRNGEIFVVEYKDRIIPVLVKNTSLTRDLYRGDKILLKYLIKTHPESPKHMVIDEKAQEPLKVLASLKDQNGKIGELDGFLVLYPKNSQTNQNVYAVQIEDNDKIKFDYFLLSEDDAVFSEIKERASNIWKKNEERVIQGRNRLFLPSVKVRVKGTVQVISKKQGNPQINVKSSSDLEFKESQSLK